MNYFLIRSPFSALMCLALFGAWFFTGSCGFPNPSFFANEANPPFSLKTYSSNSTIFLKIQSFNKSDVRKLIKGYNLYFGYVDEDEDILKRTVFLEPSNQLPSVIFYPDRDFSELEIPITMLSYSNSTPSPTEEKFVKDELLRKYVSYFFVVSPYNEAFSSAKPRFFWSCKETLEENQFDQTLSVGSAFFFDQVNFELHIVGSSLNILGVGDTCIQSLGFADSFFSIQEAPEKGYLQVPIPVQKNHSYAYKYTYQNKRHYGKIFIKNVSKNQITFDFSFQGKNGEREI